MTNQLAEEETNTNFYINGYAELKKRLEKAEKGLLSASDPKSGWQGINKECKLWQERAEKAEARLKPIAEVCDKMGKFLMKQTDACQNDADCVCPEMNDLIDEWQAIKAVGEK